MKISACLLDAPFGFKSRGRRNRKKTSRLKPSGADKAKWWFRELHETDKELHKTEKELKQLRQDFRRLGDFATDQTKRADQVESRVQFLEDLLQHKQEKNKDLQEELAAEREQTQRIQTELTIERSYNVAPFIANMADIV